MKTTTRDFVKNYVPLIVLGIIVIVVSLILLFPPFGRMVCEMNSAPGNMSATYTYVADFSFWKVSNLKMIEVVNALDEVDLIRYRQSIEEDLEKYKGLEYYENEIVVENKTLTNTINIDYKNIDKKRLQELESGFSNKMIRIRNLKKIYTKNGAVCKYM